MQNLPSCQMCIVLGRKIEKKQDRERQRKKDRERQRKNERDSETERRLEKQKEIGEIHEESY